MLNKCKGNKKFRIIKNFLPLIAICLNNFIIFSKHKQLIILISNDIFRINYSVLCLINLRIFYNLIYMKQ